jgi:hypothetical protein
MDDLTQSELSFFWTQSSPVEVIRHEVTVNGRQISAQIVFNVGSPEFEGNLAFRRLPTRIAPLFDPSGNAIASKLEAGFPTIDAGVTNDTGVPGTIAFTQLLVESTRTFLHYPGLSSSVRSFSIQTNAG